jgi:hypothetical protein
MKTTTLDYVVRNVIVQLEESSLRRYETYLQYAIRGMRELTLYSGNSQALKIKHIPMLPNKAINLPSDYIKYMKVGICVNGRVIVLGLDESLCLNENFSECGDPLEIAIQNTDNPNYVFFSFGYPFSGYYHNNQYVNSLFGLGGGFNSRGYFRVNHEMNQIQFASTVPDSDIVLEYISDGVTLDGTAIVPVEAVEYLIAFVHWKRVEAKRDSTESEIARWRNESMIKFRNCKHFNLMFTPAEYLDSYRSNVYQTPKR